MKTLLYTIVVLSFFALPLLAAEDVKVDISGRLAVGYGDEGSAGLKEPVTFPAKENAMYVGSFIVPDAKIQANAKLAEDITGVIRLNFDGGTANGADRAYVQLDNVIKKLAKSDTVNPNIYVGLMKVNFGEETWSNNVVENALVKNSIAMLSGDDIGIEFRQTKMPIDLPVILGYSLSILNSSSTAGVDNNNAKGYVFKAMGQMKSIPLYFSINQYDSGKFAAGSTPAMGNELAAMMAIYTPGGIVMAGGEYYKLHELDVRFDVLEGSQTFDPSKAPLASDAKAVLRLSYAQGTKGVNTLFSDKEKTMMLDGLYNVDKQWYVAFRYSSFDTDGDKFTRISIGGGHKFSENAILKLDYTTNTEPTALVPDKIANDSVNLLMTVKW
jgi:hypothetical protein